MFNLLFSKTVIVADGIFPSHSIPLSYLESADRVICTDGAADSLVKAGFVPDAIVGDLDSVSDELRVRFSDRIFPDSDQETNDLTKAVKWAIAKGSAVITIIGGTGKREDHTVANISLLAEYAVMIDDIKMVTDTGIFIPALGSRSFDSFPGQQVSIFSLDPATEISSEGLKYPLRKRRLSNWWCGSLNEATGSSFSLIFRKGRIIVFRKFE